MLPCSISKITWLYFLKSVHLSPAAWTAPYPSHHGLLPGSEQLSSPWSPGVLTGSLSSCFHHPLASVLCIRWIFGAITFLLGIPYHLVHHCVPGAWHVTSDPQIFGWVNVWIFWKKSNPRDYWEYMVKIVWEHSDSKKGDLYETSERGDGWVIITKKV